MLSITTYNNLSARAEVLTEQLARAAIAHHPVVSPFEELERWLSRRSQVLHLQLTLLRQDDAPDPQPDADSTLAQRYLGELDELAGQIRARYAETIKARMSDSKTVHVVAEDGSGFVALDAGELARRLTAFDQRLEAEMAVHRRFSFGQAHQRESLRNDLQQEWSAIETMLCDLKEQLDTLNLPTVEQQTHVTRQLALLRAERHAAEVDAGLHEGWLLACESGEIGVVGAVLQTVPVAGRRAFIDRLGVKGRNQGRNAFHLACENQDLALAAWLLRLGADPRKPTDLGRLPMHLAAHVDRGERTRTLLSWLQLHGADPKARDPDLRSPLNEAVYYGNRSAVCWLLDQGASLAERDRQQRTPLHVAAAAGHAAMVVLLLARGADPGARNGAGERPIFEACRLGRVEAMQAFLDAGLWLTAAERQHLQQSGMVGAQTVAAACGIPLRGALAQLAAPALDASNAVAEMAGVAGVAGVGVVGAAGLENRSVAERGAPASAARGGDAVRTSLPARGRWPRWFGQRP